MYTFENMQVWNNLHNFGIKTRFGCIYFCSFFNFFWYEYEQTKNKLYIQCAQENVLLLPVIFTYSYIQYMWLYFLQLVYVEQRIKIRWIHFSVGHAWLCCYIVRNSMASSTEKSKYSISSFPSSLFSSEFSCLNAVIAWLKEGYFQFSASFASQIV